MRLKVGRELCVSLKLSVDLKQTPYITIAPPSTIIPPTSATFASPSTIQVILILSLWISLVHAVVQLSPIAFNDQDWAAFKQCLRSRINGTM